MLRADSSAPAGHGAVRRHNLALVLQLLSEHGQLSRAAIASTTGLTRATTSSLVADLMERGLVRELGVAADQRMGRPATMLEVDGSHAAAIGMELNVGAMTTSVLDLGGRVLFERRRPMRSEQRPSNEIVVEVLREIDEVRGHLDGVAIIGIGLAIAGLVDSRTGVVHVAPNLGWRNEPFGELLRAAMHDAGLVDVPIILDNEANFGAFAELTQGGAVGVDDFIYLLGEAGVGGGVVSGGRLMRGATGYAGEIGHMTLVRDGDPCGCGSHGCWETLVGLTPMLRRAVPDIADRVADDDSLNPEAKIAFIVERAEAGDQTALCTLHEVGEWLGIGVGNLIDMFNPSLVIIAGALAEVAPWVIPPAHEVLRDHTVASNEAGCVIETSSLGFRAASLGAALQCIQRVRDDPTSVRRRAG